MRVSPSTSIPLGIGIASKDGNEAVTTPGSATGVPPRYARGATQECDGPQAECRKLRRSGFAASPWWRGLDALAVRSHPAIARAAATAGTIGHAR